MMTSPKTETQFNLFHGDCLQGLRQHVPDKTVDVIVTSPPYNIGVDYGQYHDRRPDQEYLDWCVDWSTEIKRVLKDDGSFFLNIGAPPSDPLLPHQLILRLTDQFTLQNTFHWIKSIAVPGDDGEERTIGHYKPVNSSRYVHNALEFVFHLTKDGKTPLNRLAVGVSYSDKSNIARWDQTGGQDRKCRGNTWFIPYQTIQERAKDRPHPATFPTALATRCIRLHGHPEDCTVLDPFLGIGHAAYAAKECAVARFIGFEIDQEYLRVASDKLGIGWTPICRTTQGHTVSSVPG